MLTGYNYNAIITKIDKNRVHLYDFDYCRKITVPRNFINYDNPERGDIVMVDYVESDLAEATYMTGTSLYKERVNLISKAPKEKSK